jgi:membrane protein DedA with SNARE-associated domain
VFEELSKLLAGYGYAAVAGTIALESLGLPLPGEAALVGAAIYAATEHKLNIWWIVFSCAAGAAIGSIVAYGLGRWLGIWLLRRYGKKAGVTSRRLKLAQYVFHRHGWAIVFFARFVAVLRSLAALLAGANHMRWIPFVVFNTAGAIVWSALYGFGAFYFTDEVKKLSGPVGLGVGITAAVVVVAGVVWVHRHEDELEKKAEEVVRKKA